VGPQGKVYAYYGTRYDDRLRASGIDPDNQGVQLADFRNVVALHSLPDDFRTPEPVDLVWTSDNYHDLHNANFLTNVAKMNAAIFAALKPGGYYLVIDHRAVDGAGVSVTGTLHRMDQAVARRELEAAGFRFVAASDVLTRPADDRTKAIVEQGLHDHTDQFVLKFQKPR
jgi:predicted methyltransferase